MKKDGAVAQLGERYVRNVQVGGSIPLCSTDKAVLDGELAVPCNLQSATAGLNSHPSVFPPSILSGPAMMIVRVLRNKRLPKPVRTGR